MFVLLLIALCFAAAIIPPETHSLSLPDALTSAPLVLLEILIFVMFAVLLYATPTIPPETFDFSPIVEPPPFLVEQLLMLTITSESEVEFA